MMKNSNRYRRISLFIYHVVKLPIQDYRASEFCQRLEKYEAKIFLPKKTKTNTLVAPNLLGFSIYAFKAC